MKLLPQVLTQPKLVGAIAESSAGLTELITDHAQLKSAHTVVELGTGTGVFTTRILEKMNSGSKYIGIELYEDFVHMTKKKNPTADIVCGSAIHLHDYLHERGLNTCDRIISGLPWTAFDDALQEALLDELYESLEKGGLFLTFSYFLFHKLPRGKTFKRKLDERFSMVEKTEIVANIPPAFVYVCAK